MGLVRVHVDEPIWQDGLTEPSEIPLNHAGFGHYEAAQESNLPTDGLHRPAGFEDRMGHRAPAAPRRAVYDPDA
jgi:hypothetical protein